MGGFTFIDLFSGIGGFRLAAEHEGGRCLGFSEINKDAIDTYCANFNESSIRNLGDIRKIKRLPQHDLLTAGVPCQSWSIAGKNLGFDDERGQLWDDALWLLEQSKPKAFIFENVKGLADPRNHEALAYIMERIRKAGYHASTHLMNAYDYGMIQHRVRIYIVGFREKRFFDVFIPPMPQPHTMTVGDIIGASAHCPSTHEGADRKPRWSLSCNEDGLNDYFLLNDIRNGHSTIHSWDIQDTTARQKQICLLLLRNRRKKLYGDLDGNPLSLRQLQSLDTTITQEEIDSLVDIGILKPEEYLFRVVGGSHGRLTDVERAVIGKTKDGMIVIDKLKNDRELKIMKADAKAIVEDLCRRGILECEETRYDFKNTKISTGLSGVSRIILPSSKVYPTLVASDTNDYVTSISVEAGTKDEFKAKFIENVYKKGIYRKITKREACRIQGFPDNFLLPESRPRWMKLVGNSVAVPLISLLVKAIADTNALDDKQFVGIDKKHCTITHGKREIS